MNLRTNSLSLILWIITGILIIISPQSILARTDIEKNFAKADSLFRTNNFDAAKKIYRLYVKSDSMNVQALLGLTKIYIEEKEWSDAKGCAKSILKRDKDNIDANYYKGICHREIGVNSAPVIRQLQWRYSRKNFEAAIAKDSSYKDVIFQYAKLKRYQGNYKEAIQLDHKQIRIKPELLIPQVKLFRFYRYFITHEGKDDVVKWLTEQNRDIDYYYIGEKLRREKEYAAADSIFNELLDKHLNFSRIPIFLSLARLCYAINLHGKSESYYWKAIERIENIIDANLVFEDMKYIVTDEELDFFSNLKSKEEFRTFFKALWTRRNPTPASETNIRLIEHYRRLLFVEENYEFDGFRTYFNNPDKMGYLSFTKSYELNNELNDKGLIYLRHGKADDWSVALGADTPANESWLYYATPQSSKMIFHFTLENSPGYWRFTPIFTDAAILDKLLGWDNVYYQLLRGNDLEKISYQQQLADASKEAVTEGLSTDRHTWQKAIRPINIPTSIDYFRGQGNNTIIEVNYIIPVSQIKQQYKIEDKNLQFTRGISIHNSNWKPVTSNIETGYISTNNDDIFIDQYRFIVPPDSYNISFHAEPLNYDLLGGWKVPIRVYNFTSNNLLISDVQLAAEITQADIQDKFVKNGLRVITNPTHTFHSDKPVFIYFEVYNLSKDSDNKTGFTIEYKLSMQKNYQSGLKKLMNIFGGGGKSTISTQTDRDGTETTSVEFLAIDVSKMKPGKYKLTVKVKDKFSGETTSRSAEVVLLEK